MIGRKVLEIVSAPKDIADKAAAEADRMILDFAVKDIDDLRDRIEHLVGLRLVDALADPNASASHINAAMKWLDGQKDKGKALEVDPVAAAVEAAREAMQEGGKLPEIDEYAEDQT